MTLEASSLSSDQKRALLDHIRQQLGDEAYRKAISDMGEDIVLEAFLTSAQGQTGSESTASSSEPGIEDVHWFVQGLIWVGCIALSAVTSQIEGRWGNTLSGFFLIPAFLGFWMWGQILRIGCGWLLGLTVLGAIFGAIFNDSYW